ncbi:hypothetical protein R1sor_022734 [Riccia sorocarpa]|uniref:Uncharacterized protein n=1 Tax=Riccia sorocarpa TaxID=122646 RepID=A0ABD3GLE6_9MARC
MAPMRPMTATLTCFVLLAAVFVLSFPMLTQGRPYNAKCTPERRRLLQDAWSGTIESFYAECGTEADQECQDCLDALNPGSTVYDLFPVTYFVTVTDTAGEMVEVEKDGKAWCAAAVEVDDENWNCTLCYLDFV